MRLLFSTPAAFSDGICAASYGFPDAPNPMEKGNRSFHLDLSCALVMGSYDEVLSQIPYGSYQAGVVLLGNAGNEDRFIQALSERVQCPLTGGSAAIDPISGERGLVFGRNQAAVYLFRDSRYQITVETRNIHEEILGNHTITMESPRIFASIDGENALEWYNTQRDRLGLSEEDFEHLTFSDLLGVNAHLSVENGKLCSGRDLEPTMVLRYVAPERVFPQMLEFYQDKHAVIFGCAGLKGILPQPLMTDGCGLFMFGEVATVNGVSKFGNLMLSKLCVRPKA